MVPLHEFIGKSTIMVGEVNTGKTAYAKEVLRAFVEQGDADLAVIDMAPERVKGVGGKLDRVGIEAVRYMTGDMIPPRLTGKTKEEILELAQRNARLIETIFEQYEARPADVLGVNDVSMYLQAGRFERFAALIDTTPTVVMNGYFGSSLGGGKLGERERGNMTRLMKRCDRVIRF
ncbi:MAG: hypothetical protein JRF65_13965 [Deltaproteobacteria bacterium]|nr:hypothetical protein [Deltaproteobacteria bacterium]